jgi:hypothetical protein
LSELAHLPLIKLAALPKLICPGNTPRNKSEGENGELSAFFSGGFGCFSPASG